MAPAAPKDMRRVWRSVRAAGLFEDELQMRRAAQGAPYRVMVGGSRFSPRIVIARLWRAGRPALAVQFMVAVLADRCATVEAIGQAAHDAGFQEVISPMLAEADALPFVLAGFRLAEQVFVMSRAEPGRAGSSQAIDPPGGIGIRAAAPGDVGAMLKVDAESFDGFWRYGEGDIEELTARDLVRVACDGEQQVVGYTIGNVSQHQGSLVRLAVASAQRGRGLGSALVSDAALAMRERGARKLILCTQTSNDASQRLYARLGFAKVGPALGLYTRLSRPLTRL